MTSWRYSFQTCCSVTCQQYNYWYDVSYGLQRSWQKLMDIQYQNNEHLDRVQWLLAVVLLDYYVLRTTDDAATTMRVHAVASRESSGWKLLLEVRLSRRVSCVVLHLHHNNRTQHHLWHHRRHVLWTARPQGLSCAILIGYITGGLD